MKNPTIIIFPYKTYSGSAQLLKHEISIRNYHCKIARENRNYLISSNDVVVNWGNSNWPEWLPPKANVLNSPIKVNDACNKINTFQILETKEEVLIPSWTTDKEEATEWNINGDAIVIRNKIKSSGGDGITLINPYSPNTITEAPLYVKYINKKYEFRVHVFKNKVVDVQQKKHNFEIDIPDYKIRSYANGWVFSRQELVPEALDNRLHYAALCAVNDLGLSFGAVDIIYNSKHDSFYVLEVNTAPGLQGQTIHIYADEIIRHFKNR